MAMKSQPPLNGESGEDAPLGRWAGNSKPPKKLAKPTHYSRGTMPEARSAEGYHPRYSLGYRFGIPNQAVKGLERDTGTI